MFFYNICVAYTNIPVAMVICKFLHQSSLMIIILEWKESFWILQGILEFGFSSHRLCKRQFGPGVTCEMLKACSGFPLVGMSWNWRTPLLAGIFSHKPALVSSANYVLSPRPATISVMTQVCLLFQITFLNPGIIWPVSFIRNTNASG